MLTLKLHPTLTPQKWGGQPLGKQLLHIVAEVNRTKNALRMQAEDLVTGSLDRAFELVDLTIETNRGNRILREILRFREVLAEFYVRPWSQKTYPDFIRIMKVFMDLDPAAHALKAQMTF